VWNDVDMLWRLSIIQIKKRKKKDVVVPHACQSFYPHSPGKPLFIPDSPLSQTLFSAHSHQQISMQRADPSATPSVPQYLLFLSPIVTTLNAPQNPFIPLYHPLSPTPKYTPSHTHHLTQTFLTTTLNVYTKFLLNNTLNPPCTTTKCRNISYYV
jgi:hypothetical protein